MATALETLRPYEELGIQMTPAQLAGEIALLYFDGDSFNNRTSNHTTYSIGNNIAPISSQNLGLVYGRVPEIFSKSVVFANRPEAIDRKTGQTARQRVLHEIAFGMALVLRGATAHGFPDENPARANANEFFAGWFCGYSVDMLQMLNPRVKSPETFADKNIGYPIQLLSAMISSKPAPFSIGVPMSAELSEDGQSRLIGHDIPKEGGVDDPIN